MAGMELISYFISLFKNGEERYKTSPLFKNVIMQLVNGADPYQIIDALCTTSDEQCKIFADYVDRDTRPFVVNVPFNPEPEKATGKRANIFVRDALDDLRKYTPAQIKALWKEILPETVGKNIDEFDEFSKYTPEQFKALWRVESLKSVPKTVGNSVDKSNITDKTELLCKDCKYYSESSIQYYSWCMDCCQSSKFKAKL